jgi:hypothetical protein
MPAAISLLIANHLSLPKSRNVLSALRIWGGGWYRSRQHDSCTRRSVGRLSVRHSVALWLEAEILALRHQLAVLQRQAPRRPRLGRSTRVPGGAAADARPDRSSSASRRSASSLRTARRLRIAVGPGTDGGVGRQWWLYTRRESRSGWKNTSRSGLSESSSRQRCLPSDALFVPPMEFLVGTGDLPQNRPNQTVRCPFVNLPTSRTSHWGEGITEEDMSKLRWVKPKVVVEVSFVEWPRDGLLRHSRFVGLRDDMDARNVQREPT